MAHRLQRRAARRSRATLGLGAAASTLWALFALGAQPVCAQQTSSLSWVRLPGAEPCISTQALAERVEERLGRRAFVSASQADLSLEGRVEYRSSPEAFVAHLVVSDRHGRVLGERVLRAAGPDCAALEPSLVLVIAIAIDPGASLPAVLGPERALSEQAKTMLEQLELPKLSEQQLIDELTAPAPAAKSGPRDATDAPRDHESAAPQRPVADDGAAGRVELRLAAGMTLALGVLPEPAFGGVLTATIAPPAFWPIDVWVEGLLEQEQPGPAGRGQTELAFLGGGLGLCPPLFVARGILLRACGGARLGAVLARGSGFAASRTANGFWFEPTLATGIWWRLSALSLHAGAGVGLPVVRDRFRIDDSLGHPHTVHRAGAVTGHIELGAGAQF